MLSSLKRSFDIIDRVTITLAALALVGMAIVQGWQVFARYILNDSPSWTEPLALLCMSTTMMMGAATGVRASRHFGFYILVEAAGPIARKVLLSAAHLTAAAIGTMLALWGAQMAAEAWDYAIAGALLPQGVVYLPLCIGGALITLFSIERVLDMEQLGDSGTAGDSG